MTDGRRKPHSPQHRARISAGLRRSAWNNRQATLARQGLPHGRAPVTKTLTLPGGIAVPGDCHWCVFWRVNPGHTGEQQP